MHVIASRENKALNKNSSCRPEGRQHLMKSAAFTKQHIYLFLSCSFTDNKHKKTHVGANMLVKTTSIFSKDCILELTNCVLYVTTAYLAMKFPTANTLKCRYVHDCKLKMASVK